MFPIFTGMTYEIPQRKDAQWIQNLLNNPINCIPKKLVRLIKMCLTETYSRVRVGKNLSEKFPIRNGLKQGDAL